MGSEFFASFGVGIMVVSQVRGSGGLGEHPRDIELPSPQHTSNSLLLPYHPLAGYWLGIHVNHGPVWVAIFDWATRCMVSSPERSMYGYQLSQDVILEFGGLLEGSGVLVLHLYLRRRVSCC
ncbi:hypothetical protein P691DRAFT_261939 [Macrolepiota fuliginosa MF-IS2]|uniref:Uncharacterized protein n=1 Tax=Macrolepiota fuliginosa MF-IS2 TaxID=1400762 RepID=A0A9P6C1I5_9AGAR|nr:hypothetical protein P691DRAFT_261939 [Macrolepiota fuliginosa MF-IS2]